MFIPPPCHSFCFVNFFFKPSLYVKLQEARRIATVESSVYKSLQNSRKYKKLLEFGGELWEDEKSKSIKDQYELHRLSLQVALSSSLNSKNEGNAENKENQKLSQEYEELKKKNDTRNIAYFDYENLLLKKETIKKPPDDKLIKYTFTKIENKKNENDVPEQKLVRVLPILNIKLWTVIRDAEGYPLNPVVFLTKESTGMKGKGVLRHWGCNFAADAIITRRNKSNNKLQVVLIERTDGSEKFAFPGGFVDEDEFNMPIKASIREFLEEAIAIKEKNEEIFSAVEGSALNENIKTLKNIFGEFNFIKNNNNKITIHFPEDDKIKYNNIIHLGYLDDERNTDNAWIETIAVHWHLNPEQAEKLQIVAGDDAKADSGRFYDIVGDVYLSKRNVQPLENLFASHSSILKSLMLRFFPNDLDQT